MRAQAMALALQTHVRPRMANMQQELAREVEAVGAPVARPIFEAALWRLWNLQRSGILVLLGPAGDVLLFAPFVNLHFRNDWRWRFDPPGLKRFLNRAQRVAPRARVLREPARWWANGSLVCNILPPGGWGESMLPELYELLRETGQGLPRARGEGVASLAAREE